MTTDSRVLLHKVFAAPVIQIKFSKHSDYNFPDFVKITYKPESWKCDVNTSFPDALKNGDYLDAETIAKLKDDIAFDISGAFTAFGMLDVSWDYSNFWYNLYKEGQGQETHDHLNSARTHWSGVYYARGASPTVFKNPTRLCNTHSHGNMTNSHLAEFFFQHWTPDVKDGDIILFPPYLAHYAPIQPPGSDPRVTFSFNLFIKN